MLASPLSSVIASCCGIFPRRYVTFIREQGPAMLRLTTDPLPGSSLASHTLNSHFLDTWAIRLCTNTTDIPEDSQQLRTGQDGRGSASACVRACACVGGKKRTHGVSLTSQLTETLLTSYVKMKCRFPECPSRRGHSGQHFVRSN